MHYFIFHQSIASQPWILSVLVKINLTRQTDQCQLAGDTEIFTDTLAFLSLLFIGPAKAIIDPDIQ